MSEKSILQLYIERLRREPDILDLSEDDLDDIAHQIGMTTADMERLEKIVESHRRRGQHYLQKDELEDAAIEYDRAVILSPLDSAILYEAGMVHAELWNRYQELTNLDKSVHYLEQAYKLDNSLVEAYKYFRRLKRDYLFKEKRKTVEKKDRRTLFIIIGGISFVFLIILIFSLAQRFIIDPYHEAALEIIDTELPAGESPFFGNLPIPVTTEYDEQADRLIEIFITKSHFEEFNNTYKYTLEGVAVHANLGISGLKLTMSLIDQMGMVVHEEVISVTNPHYPFAAGIDIPFTAEVVKRDFTSVIRGAQIKVISSEPSAKRFDDGVDIIPVWEILRPDGIQLGMGLVPYSGFQNPEDEIPDFVLTFTNKGYRKISSIEIEVVWQNSKDEVLYSQNISSLKPGDPFLLPGHTRSIPVFVKTRVDLMNNRKTNIYVKEISSE